MADLEVKYFDPKLPGSFSGADIFYKSQTGASRKEVKQFLKNQPSYTFFHPINRKFSRNRVVVSQLNQTWDIDLLFMTDLREENDKYAYILNTIDVLSKFCRADKLKSKNTVEVCGVLRKMLVEAKESNQLPLSIRSDIGGEFSSGTFRRLMMDYGIKHYVTYNSAVKANIIERLNKNLKGKIYRYMTKNRTRRWIDVLPDIVFSYNHTFHSSIKMSPTEVTQGELEEKAWRNQFQSHPAPRPDGDFRHSERDTVRISHLAKVFQREYNQRWTSEVFRIASKKKRGGLNIYTLEDLKSDPIQGTFYEKELQSVTIDETGAFNIEKILKTRRRKGGKEYLVRWESYPPSMDSWIRAGDFTTPV